MTRLASRRGRVDGTGVASTLSVCSAPLVGRLRSTYVGDRRGNLIDQRECRRCHGDVPAIEPAGDEFRVGDGQVGQLGEPDGGAVRRDGRDQRRWPRPALRCRADRRRPACIRRWLPAAKLPARAIDAGDDQVDRGRSLFEGRSAGRAADDEVFLDDVDDVGVVEAAGDGHLFEHVAGGGRGADEQAVGRCCSSSAGCRGCRARRGCSRGCSWRGGRRMLDGL